MKTEIQDIFHIIHFIFASTTLKGKYITWCLIHAQLLTLQINIDCF